MSGMVVRIFLRVIAGWMLARGLPYDIADILNDPEIVNFVDIAIGALILAVSEGWLALAKRFGWYT